MLNEFVLRARVPKSIKERAERYREEVGMNISRQQREALDQFLREKGY